MFCSKCGKPNKTDADFCTSCGTSISSDNEQEKTNEKPNIENSNDNDKKKKNIQKLDFTAIKRYLYVAIAVLLIVIIAIVAFRIGGFLQRNPLEIENEVSISVATLEYQLHTIGEIATLQYYYRTLITMEDSHQIFGWNIPLTQKSFIITVDGEMPVIIRVKNLKSFIMPKQPLRHSPVTDGADCRSFPELITARFALI